MQRADFNFIQCLHNSYSDLANLATSISSRNVYLHLKIQCGCLSCVLKEMPQSHTIKSVKKQVVKLRLSAIYQEDIFSFL